MAVPQGIPGVTGMVELVERGAQSSAQVLCSLCQPLCRTLELSWYHQLENHVFSFSPEGPLRG